MAAQPIYRDYDQAGLDAQYDTRAAVPEHPRHLERWARDSARARAAPGARCDIAFGPTPAERLDVFAPAGGAAPVQVFFHGGYWRALGKGEFSFLAPPCVAAGVLFVVVDYALVPAVSMDELVRQCRAALAWVWRNAGDLGGSPERIFVSGHSAGGHLVAMMMATDWPAFAGIPAGIVKGGTAISGLFDLEPIRKSFLNETLGMGADEAARLSPLHLAPRETAPLILAVGGAETDEFHRQTSEFAAKWRPHGIPCETMGVAGRDHFTVLDAFAEPASPLMRAVLDQMGVRPGGDTASRT